MSSGDEWPLAAEQLARIVLDTRRRSRLVAAFSGQLTDRSSDLDRAEERAGI